MNSLTRLAVSGDVRQTTTLMLVIVAIGAAVTSGRFALLACASGTTVWLILISDQPAREHPNVVPHGIQLGLALVMAGLLFRARRQREGHLLVAQHQLLERTVQVEAAQQERTQSERLFRSVFFESPVGIGLSDEHGHFVAANGALCQLLGRAEPELLGRSSVAFTHPDDVPAHGKAKTLIETSEDGIVRVEKRYVRPSGEVRWAWLTVTRVDGPNGEPWTLAHIQDVTERKATEQALADSEANLAAISLVVRQIRTGQDPRQTITAAALDVAGANSCCIVEPDTGGLVVTEFAGLALVGNTISFAAESAIGAVFRSGQPLFVSDPHEHPLACAELLQESEVKSALWQPVVAKGVVTGVLIVTWPYRVKGATDRVVRAIELLADETAVALQHDQLLIRLAKQASTDSLTGLANRRAWDDRLPQLLAQTRRTAVPLTVALIDLDNFKSFNDQHGHLRGDALLSTTGRRLQAQLRDVDLLARWGGEEFAVALPGCDSDAALPILERLRPVVTHGQTCSIGHATWDGTETPEQLLARADAALYEAKATGRDRTIGASLPSPRLPSAHEITALPRPS